MYYILKICTYVARTSLLSCSTIAFWYILSHKINVILGVSTQINARCKIIKILFIFCDEWMRCLYLLLKIALSFIAGRLKLSIFCSINFEFYNFNYFNHPVIFLFPFIQKYKISLYKIYLCILPIRKRNIP